jgi:hypothetical protein
MTRFAERPGALGHDRPGALGHEARGKRKAGPGGPAFLSWRTLRTSSQKIVASRPSPAPASASPSRSAADLRGRGTTGGAIVPRFEPGRSRPADHHALSLLCTRLKPGQLAARERAPRGRRGWSTGRRCLCATSARRFPHPWVELIGHRERRLNVSRSRSSSSPGGIQRRRSPGVATSAM